jgi:hypothetical protein
MPPCELVDPDQKQIELLALKGENYERLAVYGIAQSLESSILKGLKVDSGKVF